MRIGELVNYIRFNKDNEFEKGVGIVKAVTVNPSNRIIYLVRDLKNANNTFHIHERAINCTPEFEDKYKIMVAEIEKLSQEGTKISQNIVYEYNNKIEALQDELLGAALNIDAIAQENEQAA